MQPVQSVKQTLFCSGSPHSQQHINNIIYYPDLESQTAVLINLKFELDGQSISKTCLVPLRKLSAVPLFRISCLPVCSGNANNHKVPLKLVLAALTLNPTIPRALLTTIKSIQVSSKLP